MLLGILVPVAVLGALVLIASAFLRRQGAEGAGFDVSPRTLLRTYLYIASLAGVILLVVGLASLANVGLAAAGGNGVYQALSGILLPAQPNTFRTGGGPAGVGAALRTAPAGRGASAEAPFPPPDPARD
ncbi:MAG: hypothetical protein M3O91_04895 [Chloroflexota bacterium]|nr:hypothetical protein [Chloroflexota bacterium]